ncbi:DHH family phosphoesterase [Mycoplasma sp. NEAQ87857]|uniref:DHH family phosphoesterase n=1 Tax=Mycoplasma sp. NEAQ87857 TaxID=2683967 RepID=UPI001E5C0E19|nr:DHH family phosphoesterase [Mycoplasma sp. NEAQ87857]
MRNKQTTILIISSTVLLFILSLILIVLFFWSNPNHWISVFLAIAIVLTLIATVAILYFAIYNFAKSRELVKKSFNGFIEEIMTNNNIGIIIYDINQKIVWSSNFISNKFNKDFIGISVIDFFIKLDSRIEENKILKSTRIEFKNNGNVYEAQFWPLSNTIVIRDISVENLFKKETWEEKAVIGEIEIDNFQLYQSILSEEQLFTINKVVVDVIKEYMEKYNLIYRQYTNGKFIIITNEKSLSEISKKEFDLFINIHKRISELDNTISKLSLSIGFARGWSMLKEKLEQAKKALVQAQSRGGDQIAIFANDHPPIYYGSNSEIVADKNRSKVNLVARILETKLKSSEIEKVIVYGHKLADLDALGASYAIYEMAKSFNKEVYIGNTTFDATAKKVLDDLVKNQSFKKEKIFVKNDQFASKFTNINTLVILVDNSDPERTDNVDALINAERDNIFVFDHHRITKAIDFCPKVNAYVDTSASSACEVITEIINFMDHKINLSSTAAQLLLNGIYLDTNQFTKSTTTRAFEAAAWLETKGAKATKSSEILKIDDDTFEQVQRILSNIKEVKEGFYLAYTEEEATNDVISIAANEILKIQGRVASFVVAKLKGTKLYKLSARGIDTNVQIICEAVGGGGHFGTAAAVSDEDLTTFIDNIWHAIMTTGRNLNESNIN